MLGDIHVVTAALSGNIYLGRVNKAGNAFTGTKHDVTNEAKKAVIEHMLHGMPEGGKGMAQIFSWDGGATRYEIAVRPVTTPEGMVRRAFKVAVPMAGIDTVVEVNAIAGSEAIMEALKALLTTGSHAQLKQSVQEGPIAATHDTDSPVYLDPRGMALVTEIV